MYLHVQNPPFQAKTICIFRDLRECNKFIDLLTLFFADYTHDVVSIVTFKVVKEHRNSFSLFHIQIAWSMRCTSEFSRHVTMIANDNLILSRCVAIRKFSYSSLDRTMSLGIRNISIVRSSSLTLWSMNTSIKSGPLYK